MSDLIVRPVQTRRDKKRFLQFPWKHYRGDPNWIPPLRGNQKELAGYKHHPFYLQATSQTFLALKGGEVCGRIAAIVNDVHNRKFEEKRGFFGFFESIDDQAVASALLDAACQWVGERGMTAIRGPMSPGYNYEVGMLVEGFDSPPTFMMTYNPDYYGKLMDNYGLVKSQDLYAFWGHIDMMDTLDKKLDFVIQEAKKRFKFELRRVDPSRFREDVKTFLKIYNESHGTHWGFVPLSDAEIEHTSKGLRHLVVPEMTSIGEVNGRPVGTCFGMLDYNPRIKQIDGRLYPFGVFKLLRKRREIKKIRLIANHVLPEYQRWGLGLVLLNRLLPDILEWGIQEVEFSWVAESNHLSRGTLERGGAKRIKTYRVYDYDLDASS